MFRESVLAIAFGGLMLNSLGCQAPDASLPTRTIQIQQDWQLQPGSRVAGRLVSGGIGDVSVELEGDSLYAPFDGQLQVDDRGCVAFSSPQVPAYLLRMCGMRSAKLGAVQQGDVIGRANTLQFGVFRRQPSGEWAMVEPSTQILQRILQPPP